MKHLLRYIAAGIALVLGVMAVSYLQYRFDQSDIHHAVDAVKLARPKGSNDITIQEKVAKLYGIKPELISWEPQIESKVHGTVRVRAIPPQGGGNLIWVVDLVRLSVNPTTPEAIELSHKE